MSVFATLQLVLIGLKLGGVLTLSWWWVLAPTWAPLAFAVGVLGTAALWIAMATFLSRR